MAATMRVLIVDDHDGFRASARNMLEAAGYIVCGEAADAATAIAETEALRPDAMLVDIHLPDSDGFEVAREVAALDPHPHVVLTSTDDAADFGAGLRNAPADGFISKIDLTAQRFTDVIAGATHHPVRSTPLRVMIAEDSYLLREGLHGLLSSQGLDVIGLAADTTALLRDVERDPPDIAIVDIRTPPTWTDEGLQAADALAGSHPGVAVLVLSEHLEAEYATRLFRGGTPGRGYLLKDAVTDADGLVDAIHRVADGETVLDPTIVDRLFTRPRVDDPIGRLSEREREILQLVAQGRTNRAIANHLVLSERTVETHVASAMRKLGIADGPEDHRRVLAVLAYLGR
jgi:DNA-binding NarL/FixJ family response regulator